MTIRRIMAAPKMEVIKGLRFEVPEQVHARWVPEIRAAATDRPVISILDEIGDDGEGGGFPASRMAAALRSIGDKDIEVQINSPGGYFFEGVAIYNMLREHPKHVRVKVLGLAGSAASVVAMAADEIAVPLAGFFMIHNVFGGAMGDRNVMQWAADYMAKFDAVSAQIYSERTGIAQQTISQMMDDGTWLSGAEAVDKGFADTLLPADQVQAALRNEAPAASALRMLDEALAKGQAMSRTERRKLLKQLTGTPRAAEEDDTPGAVDDDGSTGLRFALARLKLARA